ncbi:hypothetical protein [Acinetobacter lwoffii]|uniref:hypothetical protein n=1 Tax=Acinetobacter lwoffii TaxID=28090 RepID=UPI003BF73E0B
MGKRDRPLKSPQRNVDTKAQKSTAKDNFYSISFKYFKDTDIDPAQSINTWKAEDRILDMLLALKDISSNNATIVQTSRLTLYGEYPSKDKNEFPLPADLPSEIKWGTIQNIGGQKARIAGFLKDSIFYLVYLDKNHRFWITKPKNS